MFILDRWAARGEHVLKKVNLRLRGLRVLTLAVDDFEAGLTRGRTSSPDGTRERFLRRQNLRKSRGFDT